MKFTAEQKTVFDADRKIWSGKDMHTLFHKDVSVGQAALFVLGQNPNKVIQISHTTGERWTCQTMAILGVRAAQNLKLKLGLQQEDVIGIMAKNATFLAPMVLGAFLIGVAISPMHYTSDKQSVKRIFGLTRPKLVLCDEDAYPALKQALDEIGLPCKLYTFDDHVKELPNVQELCQESATDEKFWPEILQKGGDQTAAILCSSGTTGMPKGVCISHRKLMSRFELDCVGPDDVLFTFSTLHWISGLWFLSQSLIKGALRVFTDEGFSPELFLRIVEKYKVTHIIAAPSYASLTLQCPDIDRRDISSIRVLFCGGSAVSASLSKKLREQLGDHSVTEAYGLTEFGAMSNINKWPNQKISSVGRLNPNTKVKILSETGEPLGIGETGELYLWSPDKWTGYYGCPEMTQLTVDCEGWIRTGDLGYFDEDGFLFVVGRQKEILKYNNFQISPAELEEPIMSIPGVVEVCVFGIPDEVAGDLPAAAVVKAPGSTLTEGDICEMVARSLPEVKQLHGGVYFLSKMPKTSTGKIQRQKMLSIVSGAPKVK